MANEDLTGDVETVVNKAKKSAAALLDEATSQGSAKAEQARRAMGPAIERMETGLGSVAGCVRSSPLTALTLAFLTGVGMVLLTERRRH